MELNSRGRQAFILAFLTILSSVGAQPNIISTGRALEGTDFTVRCVELTAVAPVSMRWTRVDKTGNPVGGVQIGDYHNKDISGIFESTSTLVIPITRNDDKSQLTCETTTNAFRTTTTKFTIYVDVLPSDPKITGQSDISEGENVNFTCTVSEAKPAAFLSWRWSTGAVIQDDDSSFAKNPDDTYISVSKVSFIATQDLDQRSLICEANHNRLAVKKTDIVRINVIYKPSVIVDKIYYDTQVGAKLVLGCTVNSNPPATNVQWLRNDTALVIGGRYSIGDNTKPSLTITSVIGTDAGIYVCTATNNAGTLKSEPVRVEVKYRPVVVIVGLKSIRLEEGERVTLGCVIDSNPAANVVIWTRGGTSLIPLDTIRYEGSVPSNPSLVIKSATRTDAAAYRCTAENNYGTGLSADLINVIVNYPPTIVTITPTAQTVNEGTPASLQCVSDGEPQPRYEWKKGGEVIGSSSLYIVPETGPADHGEYTCSVTNERGNNSQTIQLNIRYKPQVNIPLDAYGADEFQSVTIPCNYIAEPPATSVQWTKGITPLNSLASGGKYSGGTRDIANLTITNLDSGDAGNYKCTVTNDVGTGTDSTSVDISFAPVSGQILNPTPQPEEGNPVTLTCSASGVPEPIYTWYKNGDAVFTGKILNLLQVSETDSGQYVCVATNDKGSTNATVGINVQYSPKLKFTGDVQAVGGDSNAVIPLEINSNPAPSSIAWFKDGLPLNMSTPKYTGGTVDNPSVTINNLVPGDNGVYHVEVTNDIGTKKSPLIRVTGLFAPDDSQINNPTPQPTEGDVVTLTCSANGVPEPIYTWYKNGEFVFVGKILNLNPVSDTDSGLYLCMASNDKGHINATSVLDVQYSPKLTFTGNVQNVGGDSKVIIPLEVNSNPEATSIAWYKNGSPFDLTPANKYSGGTIDNPSLTINNLVSEDNGVYYVEVTNDIGKKQSPVINVVGLFPPRSISVIPASLQKEEFDPFTIDCHSDGSPPPSYSWIMGSETNIYIRGFKLSVASASPEHNTFFTCFASNTAGNLSARAIVEVLYKPRSTNSNNKYTANTGDRVVLVCDVNSNPTPITYKWWYKSVRLSETSNSLTVDVNNTLFGQYVCRAINSKGESEDINIILEDGTINIGQSSELSITYIVLIVLIIIIILALIIIAILFCCKQGLCVAICGKKRSNSKSRVSPEPAIVPSQTKLPTKQDPFILPSNGYMSSSSTVSRQDVEVNMNGTGGRARPKTARIRVGDEHNRNYMNGTGPIISIMEPEFNSPRPHHLPSLGHDPIEQTPVKKMKRKKKRRPKPQINEEDEAALTSNQAPDRETPISD